VLKGFYFLFFPLTFEPFGNKPLEKVSKTNGVPEIELKNELLRRTFRPTFRKSR